MPDEQRGEPVERRGERRGEQREIAPFASALVRSELALVDTLKLSPLPLRGIFGRATGEYRGRSVELVARAYSGELVQYARIVTVRGERVDVASLFVVPCAMRAAPMLAIDLVGVSDRGLVVADVAPMTDMNGDDQLAATRAAWLADAATTAQPAGELLVWCRRWRSREALAVWVDRAAELVVADVAAMYCAAFTRGLRAAATSDVRSHHASCLRDHREQAPWRHVIANMFGPTFAQVFVASVMYPDTLFG